jgi:hypothetical protein
MWKNWMLRGLVVGCAVAFAACGGSSDDDDEGTGGTGGSGGSGGSSGAQVDPRCITSECPSQPQTYNTKDECDAFLVAPCYDETADYIECSIMNEQCDADGRVVFSSLAPCDDLKQDVADCLSMQ